MSTIENRRAAWNAREEARAYFFINGANPDHGHLSAHAREGRVLALAESIKACGSTAQAQMSPGPEPAEMWEAQELAAAG